jgi:hypothetical protein
MNSKWILSDYAILEITKPNNNFSHNTHPKVIVMKPKNTEGPFNFDGRDVFFDRDKNEFWDSKTDSYLDHEIGLVLIDIYFGHHKAPLGPKK